MNVASVGTRVAAATVATVCGTCGDVLQMLRIGTPNTIQDENVRALLQEAADHVCAHRGSLDGPTWDQTYPMAELAVR